MTATKNQTKGKEDQKETSKPAQKASAKGNHLTKPAGTKYQFEIPYHLDLKIMKAKLRVENKGVPIEIMIDIQKID